MKIVYIEKYKNHRIEVYEQKPNVKIPITDEDFEKHFNRSDLNEVLGTHAYSVFDKDNKIIWSDYCDMWDTEACIDNACQDVDSLGT